MKLQRLIEFHTRRHPFVIQVAEIQSDFLINESYMLIVECPVCRTTARIKMTRFDFILNIDAVRDTANKFMKAHVNAIDFPGEEYVA
jgi:hypothetical protein